MAERATRELPKRHLGGVPVDANGRAAAVGARSLDGVCGVPCQLERVDLLDVRLPTSALDPRDEPDFFEQIRELVARGDHHLDVLVRRVAERGALERAGEARHGCERRA